MATRFDSPKIQASTITLLGLDSLLHKGQRYCIAVYQRAYSWDAEQIRRFFQALIYNFRHNWEIAFWGTAMLLWTTEGHACDVVNVRKQMVIELKCWSCAHRFYCKPHS